MELTGYARLWNKNAGLMPIEVQDLIIRTTSSQQLELVAFIHEVVKNSQNAGGDGSHRAFPDT